MGRLFNLIFCLFAIAVALTGLPACHGESKGPPDEDTPADDSVSFDGSIYFSGTWLGQAGTYELNLDTREAKLLSSVVGVFMQTAGATDAILLLTAQNEAVILRPSDGQIIPLTTTTNAYLAPNGRKYFYHDPESNTLYESHVDATGGRSFAADGRYGAHSPDLERVAYLNNQGVVLTDADNTSPTQVDFTGLVKPDETFIVPESGDYFPRWSPDGERVVVSVMVANADGSFNRGLAIVTDRAGVLQFYLANSPTEPAWSADGKLLYYISEKTIYAWDFDAEQNLYIDGGSNTVNSKIRLNRKGNYLGFVRLASDGRTGAQVYDQADGASTIIVPSANNGASSLDWPRQSYCTAGGNAAPTLTKVEVLVDGVVQENPQVTPPSVAVLRLYLSDGDCNLRHGVALYQTGDNIRRPVSLNLPADAGCNNQTTDLPAPVLAPGTYEISLTVEDICGSASGPATFPLTYLEAADDDDDNDDNDNDNDNDTTP
ncbi:MAG: hypothetical protein GX444_00190 [Myxococcales bacterium]|nr:hypothetical protein [Myxococcales bacterium]